MMHWSPVTSRTQRPSRLSPHLLFLAAIVRHSVSLENLKFLICPVTLYTIDSRLKSPFFSFIRFFPFRSLSLHFRRERIYYAQKDGE
jgi:hypothetical protein